MGTFFIYILKSSVCLALFYLFFRLLLSRETFHRFNRIALLGVLLLSWSIPSIELGVGGHIELNQAVLSVEQLLLMAQEIPASDVVSAVREPAVSWIRILLLIYFCGILFFMGRGMYSLGTLLCLLLSCKREKQEKGIILAVHEKEVSPFSWMQFIVVSRKDLEENGREILIHEKAHVRNRHSVDLLIADICVYFQWFNPAAWLLKQELQNVHEYEADETVVREGVSAKEYQLLLIKKAVGTRLYSMANSFNHSKLKKRITMMLQKKSNPWARLKYLYVLPVAAVAMTVFARPEVSARAEEFSTVKVNDLTAILETNAAVIVQDSLRKIQVEKKKDEVDPKTTVKVFRKNYIVKKKGMSVSLIGVPSTDKPLFFIDGKEVDSLAVDTLSPELVKNMEATVGKIAMIKHGKRARGGIISIRMYDNKGDKMSGKEPLILLDGKEITAKEMKAIDPNEIAKVVVLKDSVGVTKYGASGKEGVILIRTKKAGEPAEGSEETKK